MLRKILTRDRCAATSYLAPLVIPATTARSGYPRAWAKPRGSGGWDRRGRRRRYLEGQGGFWLVYICWVWEFVADNQTQHSRDRNAADHPGRSINTYWGFPLSCNNDVGSSPSLEEIDIPMICTIIIMDATVKDQRYIICSS